MIEFTKEEMEEVYQTALLAAKANRSSDIVAKVVHNGEFHRKMSPELYLRIDNQISVLSVIVKDQADEIAQLVATNRSFPKTSLMNDIKRKLKWLSILLSKRK